MAGETSGDKSASLLLSLWSVLSPRARAQILAPTTPQKLFRHEISIWASLKHTHVLELLGASSATGDPPWFFVSPYMKNGTIVSFLKSVASGELGRGKWRSALLAVERLYVCSTLTSDGAGRRKMYPGPLQMMQEVAIGMAYLHREGVLHGDLKVHPYRAAL